MSSKNLTVKNKTVRKFQSDLQFFSKIIPFRVGGKDAAKRVLRDDFSIPNKHYNKNCNTIFPLIPLWGRKNHPTKNPQWGTKIDKNNPLWGMETQESLVVGGAA